MTLVKSQDIGPSVRQNLASRPRQRVHLCQSTDRVVPRGLCTCLSLDQKMCMHALTFSHVQLFETLWTVAFQDPLSIEFSRQEYRSGLPCPPPRDLPNPGIEPTSLTSPALSGRFSTNSATWEALIRGMAVQLSYKHKIKKKIKLLYFNLNA